MRRLMTFSLVSVFAAALLHCAADGTEPGPPGAPPGNETPDGTAPSPDSGESSLPDAAVPDAPPDTGEPIDAGACSVDHWCRTPLPTADLELRAVWSFGVDDAIAVGPEGAIQWNGSSWSPITPPDAGPEVNLTGLSGLWATGPNDIWGTDETTNRIVHGYRPDPASPFQWSESAAGWLPFPISFLRGTGPRDLWGLVQWPSSSFYLVHGVLPETEGPAEPVWTTTEVPVSVSWNFTLSGFAITANKEVWIAGYTSDFGWPPPPEIAHVYHGSPPATEDGDFVWEESFTTDGSLPTLAGGLWAPNANDVWLISNLGTTYEPLTKPTVNYHRTVDGNGTAAWGSVPNNSAAYALAVWGSGTNDVWTVGTSGAIRRWDGTKWSTSPISVNGTPFFKDLMAIHGSSANDIWAVGNGIALHRVTGAP